ncbi:hypothetical protein ACTVLM_14495 [Serratia marcescens]|uniref:hypothetical protein n=1 Tax=Serratia marcescens TaxID=615 RepID=UPI003FA73E89
MDNKLSELSKPVGFVSKQAQALLKSGDTASVRPFFDVQGSSPLYSQEYVSALLAELEFEKQNNSGVAGMVEDYETKLEAKDKRIAELEAKLNHYVSAERASASFDQTAAIIKRADDAERDAEELRAKLATPVRLKKVDSSNVPYAGDGFNAAVDYCADRVRAAGFTVEGDE